jgi:hypothetical protein
MEGAPIGSAQFFSTTGRFNIGETLAWEAARIFTA